MPKGGMVMNQQLYKRRQDATSRHDAALEQWPNRDNPEFIKVLKNVVSELKEISEEADEEGEDRTERSRTCMYLGMAYFDLGMAYSKLDKNLQTDYLTESAIAYDRSERLMLGIGDPIGAAKLNFNYGNTLRGLSEGEDVKLLEATKERYQLALETFRMEAPQFASQVSLELNTLEHQLNLARLKASIEKKVNRFQTLQQKLQRAAGKITQEEEKEIQEEFEKIRQEGPGISDIRDNIKKEISGLLEGLSQKLSEESATAIQNQLDQIDKIFDESRQIKPADDIDSDTILFSLLMERFNQDVQSGKISAIRQKALKPVLGELRDLINNKPEGPDEIMDWTARMRTLAKTMTYLLAQPSIGKPEPSEESRASKVLALWSDMKIKLVTDYNQPFQGNEENKRGAHLLVQCSKCEQELYGAGNDDGATSSLEVELLRSLALEIHEYLLRKHTMIAFPYWGSKPVKRDPNSIFYSGKPDIEKMMSNICKKRGLHLLSTPTGINFATARWNQLLSSNVAVFDLSVASGPDLAAVCYELGIARSLGKSTLVIQKENQHLPFDVDVTPVIINSKQNSLKSLAESLDYALFEGPQTVSESSVKDTVAFARHSYGSLEYGFEVKKALEYLEDVQEDAILSHRRLLSLIGLLKSDAPMIILPSWRPHYPKAGEIGCFHVMPFSEDWSSQVSKITEDACNTNGMPYIRGDKVIDPRIIRSIWEEICKASHVIVDLTGFNPNVALELGIAHTLGRRTLIMGQRDTVKKLFPMIAKTRIDTYNLEDSGKSLTDSVVRFVSS